MRQVNVNNNSVHTHTHSVDLASLGAAAAASHALRRAAAGVEPLASCATVAARLSDLLAAASTLQGTAICPAGEWAAQKGEDVLALLVARGGDDGFPFDAAAADCRVPPTDSEIAAYDAALLQMQQRASVAAAAAAAAEQ